MRGLRALIISWLSGKDITVITNCSITGDISFGDNEIVIRDCLLNDVSFTGG